jgi:hypothetical protein
MFDALYTNGLFSVKIQRFIDAIAIFSPFWAKIYQPEKQIIV